MKAKRILVFGLILAFSLSMLTAFAEAAPAPQKAAKKKEAPAQERVVIPKEVKAVMQEGLVSRQGRQDIPFEIFKNIFLFAQENLYSVFFFKAKNGDLGFGPPAQIDPTGASLECRLHIFLQFLQADASGSLQLLRELNVPVSLRQETEGYDPEAVEWYSFGFALPPGQYTLAMAVASADLTKIGSGYWDFALPGPESYQANLETTPVFFVKSIEQTQTPEMRVAVHKGVFAYSVLQIVPNIDSVVAPGETIEIFYYVFGAHPVDPAQPKTNIEASYEVLKEDGTTAIRWENQVYDYALVSQPLPLKQTVMIKDESGERTEQRDLEAGKYVLSIKIEDKVSGLKAEKKVPFEVK